MDNYINSSIINIINHYCDSLNDDKIEKILWNKLSDKEFKIFQMYFLILLHCKSFGLHLK